LLLLIFRLLQPDQDAIFLTVGAEMDQDRNLVVAEVKKNGKNWSSSPPRE